MGEVIHIARPFGCPRCTMMLEAQIAASTAADILQRLATETGDMSLAYRAELIRAAAEGSILGATTALAVWRTY
jgi:hypothetical protein